MSSKVPTVRQVNWISIIPHLIVMGIIILVWNIYYPENSILFAGATYLLISYLLRSQIPKNHRRGIKLLKFEEFEKAIPYFEKSYKFLKKYNWIDKYRFLTLLSSSKMTYQEMSLANIAFCYGQTGNGKKSKEYYIKVLTEFPDNGLAKASLRMLNSVENKKGNYNKSEN